MPTEAKEIGEMENKQEVEQPNTEDLAEVREEMARVFWNRNYPDQPFEKPSTHELGLFRQRYYEQCYKLADQILNIKVRRGGGKCPECEDGLLRGGFEGEVVGVCPTCEGGCTLSVEEKSIGDIVKEWESWKQ